MSELNPRKQTGGRSRTHPLTVAKEEPTDYLAALPSRQQKNRKFVENTMQDLWSKSDRESAEEVFMEAVTEQNLGDFLEFYMEVSDTQEELAKLNEEIGTLEKHHEEHVLLQNDVKSIEARLGGPDGLEEHSNVLNKEIVAIRAETKSFQENVLTPLIVKEKYIEGFRDAIKKQAAETSGHKKDLQLETRDVGAQQSYESTILEDVEGMAKVKDELILSNLNRGVDELIFEIDKYTEENQIIEEKEDELNHKCCALKSEINQNRRSIKEVQSKLQASGKRSDEHLNLIKDIYLRSGQEPSNLRWGRNNTVCWNYYHSTKSGLENANVAETKLQEFAQAYCEDPGTISKQTRRAMQLDFQARLQDLNRQFYTWMYINPELDTHVMTCDLPPLDLDDVPAEARIYCFEAHFSQFLQHFYVVEPTRFVCWPIMEMEVDPESEEETKQADFKYSVLVFDIKDKRTLRYCPDGKQPPRKYADVYKKTINEHFDKRQEPVKYWSVTHSQTNSHSSILVLHFILGFCEMAKSLGGIEQCAQLIRDGYHDVLATLQVPELRLFKEEP